MSPIRCGAMNHVNAVIDDFDETVGFFTEVYGAQFLIDMPRDEWHGCLIAIGRVIFQLFSPHDDLLHARFGPHYVGIEYTVPDVSEARDATNARGIRIARRAGICVPHSSSRRLWRVLRVLRPGLPCGAVPGPVSRTNPPDRILAGRPSARDHRSGALSHGGLGP